MADMLIIQFLVRVLSWGPHLGGVAGGRGCDDASGGERQAADRYKPLMPGAEGFGQGQVVFGGGSRDVLEAVKKSLPLLGLDRGHGRVCRVIPAAGFLDGLEAVEEVLPCVVRVHAGGVMQVEEQGGSKGWKRDESSEQDHTGPVWIEGHLALPGGWVGDRGVVLGEVGGAVVPADRSEQSIAVGQSLDRTGSGDQHWRAQQVEQGQLVGLRVSGSTRSTARGAGSSTPTFRPPSS